MAQPPQVVYQYKCKICKMSDTNPDLFRDLHSQVLEVGASLSRAMNYINSRIENEQIPLTKLNNQNMGVHFSSHIAIPDRVNSELSRIAASNGPSLTSVNPTVGHEIEDMVRRRVGNDVGDYLNLDQLRVQMMEKLEMLDTVVSMDVDGEKKIDFEALTQYTSLIKEIRSTIVDLNKIRSSKQLMNMVIKSLVEKQTFQTVRELSREYDQVKQDLISAGVDNAVVVRVDQNMRIRLAEIVANTARSVIEDISRTYKLQ
jgi:hypothetical protein